MDLADSDVPDHDLDPPRFARRAIQRLLGDYNSVRAMMLQGYRDPASSGLRSGTAVYEDQVIKLFQENIFLLSFRQHLFF